MSDYLTYRTDVNALNICATGLATSCCSVSTPQDPTCCITGAMTARASQTATICNTGLCLIGHRWETNTQTVYSEVENIYILTVWALGECCFNQTPRYLLRYQKTEDIVTNNRVSVVCDDTIGSVVTIDSGNCTYSYDRQETTNQYTCGEIGDGCTFGLRGSPVFTQTDNYNTADSGRLFYSPTTNYPRVEVENTDVGYYSNPPGMDLVVNGCGPWSRVRNYVQGGLNVTVTENASMEIACKSMTYTYSWDETRNHPTTNATVATKTKSLVINGAITTLEAC